MKVYTKLVMDMTNWNVLEEESFEYVGPVDLCFSIGGSSEKSKSEPVKLPLWNPGQKELWEQELLPYLQEGMSGPAPRYPGMMYVPRTAEEDAYFGMSTAYSPEFASQLARDLATRKAAMSKSLAEPAFTIDPEATKAFFEMSIRDPMMKNYRDVVDPAIRESFAGPGYWSQARAQGQQAGAENLATTLGSQYGQLMYADEQARRTALENAKAREAGFAGIDVQSELAAMQAQLLQEQWGKQFAEEAGKSRADLSREIAQEEAMGELQRWLMGEQVDGVSAGQYNPYTQLVFQALGLAEFGWGQKTEGKGGGTSVSFLAGGGG